MDDRFAALAAWHDFFVAVAAVAARLVGLLFAAAARNPAVVADEGPGFAPGPVKPFTPS